MCVFDWCLALVSCFVLNLLKVVFIPLNYMSFTVLRCLRVFVRVSSGEFSGPLMYTVFCL